jgi:hypothetical protein
MFIFCDGGSHHYKSKHGFYGFTYLARYLESIMQSPSNGFPSLFIFFYFLFYFVFLLFILEFSIHFQGSYHGSDICDCIASISKKKAKKYSVGNEKWLSNGNDFVEALQGLPKIYYSDTVDNSATPKLRRKRAFEGIRDIHCVEIDLFGVTPNQSVDYKHAYKRLKSWMSKDIQQLNIILPNKDVRA